MKMMMMIMMKMTSVWCVTRAGTVFTGLIPGHYSSPAVSVSLVTLSRHHSSPSLSSLVSISRVWLTVLYPVSTSLISAQCCRLSSLTPSSHPPATSSWHFQHFNTTKLLFSTNTSNISCISCISWLWLWCLSLSLYVSTNTNLQI